MLDLNRSTLYYQPAGESDLNLTLMGLIDEQYLRTPFYGWPRMTAYLRQLGYMVNHKRVQRLMQTMGLQAIYPKPRTSQAAKQHTVYPYLLRNLAITRPNQVWSTDITYVPMPRGFMYLVAIIDWFSRFVLAWKLSNTLDGQFCLDAWDQALQSGTPEIMNSDQGAQFTARVFTQRVESAGVRVSMDGRGRALDNIFVERLWRSVKYENIYLKDYQTVATLQAGLDDYFLFYNTVRLHQSLDYSTPAKVHFHRSPDIGNSHHAHPLFDIHACRSTDNGQSWSDTPSVITDPLGGILDFGTHTLSDGSLYLHASTVELVPANSDRGSTDWRSRPGIPFWIRSTDHGQTWTEPQRFPPLAEGVWGAPASHSGVCRSGLLTLPDGRLLLPGKAAKEPGGGQPYFGMVQVSDDAGESWSYGGRLADDPIAHFSEPAIHLTRTGKTLVLFRCHPRQQGRDNCLALVTSADGGESWSPWRYTTVRGCPGHLLGLRDGRILMTVGTRWPGQQGCRARVLNPEATDLDTAPDITIRSDSSDADCGYPWAVELDSGRVLIVYYYGDKEGVHGIEGTIIEER